MLGPTAKLDCHPRYVSNFDDGPQQEEKSPSPVQSTSRGGSRRRGAPSVKSPFELRHHINTKRAVSGGDGIGPLKVRGAKGFPVHRPRRSCYSAVRPNVSGNPGQRLLRALLANYHAPPNMEANICRVQSKYRFSV